MSLLVRLCALAAVVASTGCAAGFETRVPDVDLRAPRIAALRPHVVISEYDVEGHFTPNAYILDGLLPGQDGVRR